jgi:serine/threonine protein kinase
LRQVDHPNIIKLEAVYEEENSIFIITELIEDGSLFASSKSIRKFDELTILSLCSDVFNAIKYLQFNDIIHRDIKLDNILVRMLPDGRFQAVIIDFGISAYLRSGESLKKRIGTPGFMAPEVIER